MPTRGASISNSTLIGTGCRNRYKALQAMLKLRDLLAKTIAAKRACISNSPLFITRGILGYCTWVIVFALWTGAKQNRKESCKKQESHGKFPGLEVRHEGGDNDGYSFFNTYYPSGIMISICISCLFELSLLFHKLGSVLSRQPRWDEKRPREVKQLAQRYTVNLAVCVVVGWGEICCLSSGLSSWLLSHPLLWELPRSYLES